jgi:hypothetical protein
MIWERDGFFWLRRSPYSNSGIGDIIFNTTTKIVFDNDTSNWAQVSYTECGTLLVQGKRWPDKFGEIYEGRRQNDMTRDPFIGFGLLYSHLLDHMDEAALNAYFNRIDPPPLLHYWWKRLKEDNREKFVIRLTDFKALATHNIYQKRHDDDFYHD